MAIAGGNAPVLVMNAQFGPLVTADLAATRDSFLHGFMMAAGALGTASLYVPAAVGVWHDMMTFRSFAHFNHSHAVIIKV